MVKSRMTKEMKRFIVTMSLLALCVLFWAPTFKMTLKHHILCITTAAKFWYNFFASLGRIF